MVDAVSYDGFVSTRHHGTDFSQLLIDTLRSTRQIKAASEVNIAEVDHTDHKKAARTLIETVNFTVAVIDREGLAPRDSRDAHSHQALELQAAEEVRRKRHGEEGAPPHGLFIVHLTDTPDRSAVIDVEEMLQEQTGIAPDNAYFFEVPNTVSSDAIWKDHVEGIVARIRLYLRDHGIERVLRRASRPGALSAIRTKVDLNEAERAYLDTHLEAWLRGHGDGSTKQPVPGSTGPYHNSALFEFHPSRCIRLEGIKMIAPNPLSNTEEGNGDEGVAQSIKRRPLLKYVFEEKKKPVMLVGTAGAGKSTTLAITACLHAARCHPEFRQRTADLLGTSMGNLALDENVLKVPHVPVVMSCSRLADELSAEAKTVREDWQSLLTMIARMMDPELDEEKEKERAAAAREALLARLKARPYLLILDALDEVIDDRRARRILQLARSLYKRRDAEGLKIDVLISSRPTARDLRGIYCARIAELRIAQIETYFGRYADSQPDATPTRRDLFRTEAKEQFDDYGTADTYATENMRDFLSMPFNLNCFCWLVWENSGTGTHEPPRSETVFFKTIIEYLIREPLPSLDFGTRPLTKAMLRVVLQRLAYDALLSSGEKGTLPYSMAVQTCRHALTVVSAYQTDDESIAIADGYPETLIDRLCNETDLLIRDADLIRFGRLRFCEYLAAERIDADALATAFLGMLPVEKLIDLIPTLRFCYALRLEWDVADYASNVLSGLLERARAALKDGNDDIMLSWLDAALECLRIGFETGFSDETTRTYDQRGYGLVRDRALPLLKECRDRVDPARRAETLERMLRLGRRPDPNTTVTEVRQLVMQLLGRDSRWKSFPIPGPDRPEREIEIERTTVLVCEYEEFLSKTTTSDEDVWSHAPPEHRVRLSDFKSSENETDDYAEQWRDLRRRPGNPIVNVTWYEAVAYARWVNMVNEDAVYRLPTVEELQSIYAQCWGGADVPWGEDDLPGSGINWRGFSYDQGTTPPGTFESDRGLVDLGSNVRLWTLPVLGDGLPVWPPMGVVTANQNVYGGSWIDDLDEFELETPASTPSPDRRNGWIGLRLVKCPFQ